MRRLLVLAAVFALVLAVMAPSTASAADDRFDRIDINGVDVDLAPALADPDRVLTVMIEMEREPVAAAQADARASGRELSRAERAGIRADLRAEQDGLRPDIERLGGTVQSQLQDAYNGIRVRIQAAAIPELANLPGVATVHALDRHEPDNSNSVPFLGTPEVWADLGFTGTGVSIGIIDTGIDYYHANFGGSGDPDDYANDDPTIIEPGTFPTVKIAGGHDFVGDAYDASSDDPAINTPVPDPDPLDCNFHGSHVGGSAGGQGVLLDGSTYTGPYDDTTHDNEFGVGPGVAPEATLYALKVFGCDGSTDVTVDAINWAVANDLDVINMSLGSPYGRPSDPSAVASTNAVAAGVVVVTSAGNSGPSPYITGSPGVGAGTISTAALDTIAETPHVNYIAPGDTIDMQNSNGSDDLPVTAEVHVLQDDPATGDVDESLGCNPSDYPAEVAGKIVITFRALCARIDRAINGQAAGAAAVVMITNAAGFPPFEGTISGVTIPFLGALQDDTDRIVATDGQTVTIEESGGLPNPTFENFAGFSSGGPANGDSSAKPDVIAPGVSIVSTFFGTGFQGVTSSGTSMASPHVAGLAALVRQAHPSWPAVAVKAAIVNTSDPDLMIDYLTTRAGSGVVVPTAALATEVLAMGDPFTSSLSFGFDESTGVMTDTKTATLHNLGSSAASYDVSIDWNTDAAGVASGTLSSSTVTVGGNSRASVDLTLSVDGASLPAGFVTASGAVVFDPGSGPVLRVPFVAVVRGNSSLATSPTSASVRGTGPINLTTTNATGAPGTVDSYAWSLTDPRDATFTDVNAVGVQTLPGADLGVFAISTNTRNSNPSINEWDVLVDTDRDGVNDYAVVGFDGALFADAFEGTLLSFTFDLDTGDLVDLWFAGGGLDSSVVLLPFGLSAVGLTPGNAEFSFISGVFSREGAPDDIVNGVGHYNAFDQPIESGAFAELEAGGSASWTAAVDPVSMRSTPVRGLMLVYVENANGNQAQLIRVSVRRAR